ncbi:MAG TPA: DUF1839 family protein [Acidimicrobiales bacterium]|jgi:hypothetical protein|nr:DUF1839 family protein [Acidimicrobiales bacterium]
MIHLLDIDPATYERHAVHAPTRAYPETNCYTDIIIELLHARGDEPLAALGCTVEGDFEGDQFTFFKPPPEELEQLFGVDIHEMQPYRALPLQAAEQIQAGRTIIVELDSYFLPDTAATSYRREHVKSSVVVEGIDPDGREMRYFHNAGVFDVDGDDFREVFTFASLPPYTELVRFDAGPRLEGDALRSAARALLPRHLDRRPARNPFDRFGVHLGEQLPALIAGDAEWYHAYAFATVRMAGAGFELAASYAAWLVDDPDAPVAQSFAAIVEGCKRLSFKLARRRPFDSEPAIAELSAAWDEAQERLDAATA